MTKEVWLSPRADGFAGNGTPSDPLDGSAFDALAQSFAPGMTIHLGPGIYTTKQWVIPPQCAVRGAGMYNTTIQFDPEQSADISNQVVLSNHESDGCVSVSDLTIDGHFSVLGSRMPIERRKIDCLVLFGSCNHVSRVRVMGFGGTMESQQEAFGILNKNIEGVPSIGTVVEHCFVTGGNGNYDNGISVCTSVAGARLVGNTVLNMFSKGGTGHAAGIGATSGEITGNTISGALWGAYFEGANAVIIHDNQFLDCRSRGLRFLAGAKNVTIGSNLIELRDDSPGAVFVEMDDENQYIYTGSKIERNTFALKSGATRFPVFGIKLPVAAGRGEHLTNNTFDARINQHQLAKDAVCLGNRTLNGAVMPALMDRKGRWGK